MIVDLDHFSANILTTLCYYSVLSSDNPLSLIDKMNDMEK